MNHNSFLEVFSIWRCFPIYFNFFPFWRFTTIMRIYFNQLCDSAPLNWDSARIWITPSCSVTAACYNEVSHHTFFPQMVGCVAVDLTFDWSVIILVVYLIGWLVVCLAVCLVGWSFDWLFIWLLKVTLPNITLGPDCNVPCNCENNIVHWKLDFHPKSLFWYHTFLPVPFFALCFPATSYKTLYK